MESHETHDLVSLNSKHNFILMHPLSSCILNSQEQIFGNTSVIG